MKKLILQFGFSVLFMWGSLGHADIRYGCGNPRGPHYMSLSYKFTTKGISIEMWGYYSNEQKMGFNHCISDDHRRLLSKDGHTFTCSGWSGQIPSKINLVFSHFNQDSEDLAFNLTDSGKVSELSCGAPDISDDICGGSSGGGGNGDSGG